MQLGCPASCYQLERLPIKCNYWYHVNTLPVPHPLPLSLVPPVGLALPFSYSHLLFNPTLARWLTFDGVLTLPAASNSDMLSGLFLFKLSRLLSSLPGVRGDPLCLLLPLPNPPTVVVDSGGIGDPLTSARKLEGLLRGVLEAERK